MDSEKFKKALRMAVNVGCGFEGDAEDAASLLSLIETNEARIDDLEAEIERFTAHSDIERQDDKCSGHGDISNFPPVMGSGDGLGW